MRRCWLASVSLLGACLPPAEIEASRRWWVADPGAGVVWRDDPSGRAVALSSETPGARPGFDPSALARGPDGRLLVADFANATVSVAGPAGLEVLFENPADPAATRIEEPCALEAGPDGVVVLANDTENIAFLSPTGAVRSELGPASRLGGAHGLAVLADGTLVVATSPATPGAPTLFWWTREGAELGAFGAGLALPTDVAVLPDDTVAVADWEGGSVTRWDPASGERLEVLAEGLPHPVALAALASGGLLVLADDGVFTASGERLADGAGFVFPRDLLAD
jgi:DNA-binding beta-propeller fold protein YncE